MNKSREGRWKGKRSKGEPEAKEKITEWSQNKESQEGGETTGKAANIGQTKTKQRKE